MRAFYKLRDPKNLLDPYTYDFRTITKWFPQYKDEHEADYLRSKNQRR